MFLFDPGFYYGLRTFSTGLGPAALATARRHGDGGFMTADLAGEEEGPGGRRRSGAGMGAIPAGGRGRVGIGLLAAPDTGTKTRRRLRRKISALGADLGDGIEGVAGVQRPHP